MRNESIKGHSGRLEPIVKATEVPCEYNASRILDDNLVERSEKVALVSHGGEWTFKDMAGEANRVGNALKKLGVRPGEKVAILAPDCREWVACFFGIIKIGAIAVCLNTQLENDDYGFILKDCRATVLIVHRDLWERVGSIRSALPSLSEVIVVGDQESREGIAYQSWISRSSASLDGEVTHRDDICTINYSSGTTGVPKGVPHAHKDYLLTAELSGKQLFELSESDRTFSAAKLYFVYGIGANLIFPWHVGASIILFEGSARLAMAVLDQLMKFRPTLFFAVPTTYASLLALPDLGDRFDFRSLRCCVSAGEVLPKSLWEAWRDATGQEIWDTIGCTETFHTFMANRGEWIRPGSSGRPSPGYEVKIFDSLEKEVRPGEVGDLFVKGESTALSYLHQDQKTRLTFIGEWLKTGDLYRMDDDGYYWHMGRSDDLFKVGGMWVSPVEVERVLGEHPEVKECAVVGISEASGLVKPRAFVVGHPEHSDQKGFLLRLLRHCASRLPEYKRPRKIELLSELPRTPTGKIQRFLLREGMNLGK